MNAEDIRRLIKSGKSDVNDAIRKAAETNPSIASKFVNGRLWFNTQFNKDEVEIICKTLNLNKLQTIYVLENYIDRPETDVITISGTNGFVKRWEEDHHLKCCNTCKYLIGKMHDKRMPQPYCKVYERYVASFGKVYEDYCSSYLYIDLPKPRKWFKENAPNNLNIYGETDTVNGIDVSLFKNGEDCKGPVKLVNQVGFD